MHSYTSHHTHNINEIIFYVMSKKSEGKIGFFEGREKEKTK